MLSNKITILKSIYLSQPRPRQQQEETWRVAQSVFSSETSLYVATLTGDSAEVHHLIVTQWHPCSVDEIFLIHKEIFSSDSILRVGP